MTLLARDEADILDAQIAFHLAVGVDFVIATDNRSQDATREILQRYADAGYVHVIEEQSDENRQSEWVTRMARLAASEFGADWVINSDADEFWWPRAESLKAILEVVPERYGALTAFPRQFVPRPGDGELFAERMAVRLSPDAPIVSGQYRSFPKIVHRADPDIVVTRGNHTIVSDLLAFRGWYPIELLHFPLRSLEQCERKYLTAHRTKAKHTSRGPTTHASEGKRAVEQGKLGEYFDSFVVSDEELQRGLAEGTLVIDTRLRDALRELRNRAGAPAASFVSPQGFAVGSPGLSLNKPDLVEEMRYGRESGAFAEGELVRVQKRLDRVERRLAEIERKPIDRLRAASIRLARRMRSQR